MRIPNHVKIHAMSIPNCVLYNTLKKVFALSSLKTIVSSRTT